MRRRPAGLDFLLNGASTTNRGFTDNEHLDRTGFIHMNGRVYDPRIGRFVSPDPILQSPSFSQSYNRYAYVFNSPLSYTDLWPDILTEVLSGRPAVSNPGIYGTCLF